jgi:hypothetical protein
MNEILFYNTENRNRLFDENRQDWHSRKIIDRIVVAAHVAKCAHPRKSKGLFIRNTNFVSCGTK